MATLSVSPSLKTWPMRLRATTDGASVGLSDTERSCPTTSSDGTNTLSRTTTANQNRMIGTARVRIILATNGRSAAVVPVWPGTDCVVLTRCSPYRKWAPRPHATEAQLEDNSLRCAHWRFMAGWMRAMIEPIQSGGVTRISSAEMRLARPGTTTALPAAKPSMPACAT